MMRVAVVGATGLVGATLVERLLSQRDVDVIPLIHTSGNAWRLARRGLGLKICELTDLTGLEHILEGCTHVVNCSRGGDDVMIHGLRNLIIACGRRNIKRFVHLSSVAVYGDPPPPECSIEEAPTRPKKGTYGAIKLAQDEIVQKAAAKGLPAVILCPPNISGCHSYLLLGLLDAIRQGSFALVGDGNTPCNLVDVENLAFAIELALRGDVTDGRRLFITDDEPVNWKDVVDSLLPLVGPGARVPTLSREELERRWRLAEQEPRRSLGRSLAHLVSGEVREALRRDPLWERVDMFARRLVARLGRAVEDRMRHAISGAISVPKINGEPPINVQLSAQQLRGVRHSCDRAKSALRYRPLYGFHHSMKAFKLWHQRAQGFDSDFADLLKCLPQ